MIQFSKKIVAFVLIFWAVFRLEVLILTFVNPIIAPQLKALVDGIDVAAMANIMAYTGNSITEKAINRKE